ncbi:hypothetical protein ACFTQL_24735 [Peribacillus butanolivorans]
MFNAPSIQLAITYQSIFTFGEAAIGMTILSIPLKYVSQNVIGSFMGTMYFSGGLAGIIAPTAMGALIDASEGSFQAAFFFLIGALVVVLISAILFKFPKNNTSIFESASLEVKA